MGCCSSTTKALICLQVDVHALPTCDTEYKLVLVAAAKTFVNEQLPINRHLLLLIVDTDSQASSLLQRDKALHRIQRTINSICVELESDSVRGDPMLGRMQTLYWLATCLHVNGKQCFHISLPRTFNTLQFPVNSRQHAEQARLKALQPM